MLFQAAWLLRAVTCIDLTTLVTLSENQHGLLEVGNYFITYQWFEVDNDGFYDLTVRGRHLRQCVKALFKSIQTGQEGSSLGECPSVLMSGFIYVILFLQKKSPNKISSLGQWIQNKLENVATKKNFSAGNGYGGCWPYLWSCLRLPKQGGRVCRGSQKVQTKTKQTNKQINDSQVCWGAQNVRTKTNQNKETNKQTNILNRVAYVNASM